MSLSMQERTIRACEACHRSKCKCINDGTGDTPCVNCFKKGIPCVYKEAKKRGPRPGMVKALQEMVDELQYQLEDVTRKLESSYKENGALKMQSGIALAHENRQVLILRHLEFHRYSYDSEFGTSCIHFVFYIYNNSATSLWGHSRVMFLLKNGAAEFFTNFRIR